MRLIDADALKAEISKEWFVEPNATIFNYVFNVIDNAPTVEPEKAKEGEIVKAYTKGFDDGIEIARQKGEWGKWVITEIQCPNCFEYFETDCYSIEELNKCPNCGAYMKGGAV